MPQKMPEQMEPAMTTKVPETEVVTVWKVACDGSGPGLGHPRVWLSIPHDSGWVECGYCDKRYVHASLEDKTPEDASRS